MGFTLVSINVEYHGGIISNPDFMNSVVEITKQHFPKEYAEDGIKPDLMMPVFILEYLPAA